MFLLIMPSYNQAHYITEAIDSILNQSDPEWQLWIIDNSTDHTPEVMKKYNDPRIIFHHIPQRMDPGTCINWALERAQGRDFSYVHTDNRLDPDYVREMRAALSSDEYSIAYCDLRIIDGQGKRTSVFRRGSFDLSRLLSLSPLGVPFSATTALARKLNGFSTRDVADDVLFCLCAHGLAKFHHIPNVLMDYRAHEGSRTTEHGGYLKMEISFLKSYVRALPLLKQNDIDVLGELRAKIKERVLNMELLVEDIWYRKGHVSGIQLSTKPSLQSIWDIGFFRLPDFKPPVQPSLKSRPLPGIEGGSLGLGKLLKFKITQRRIRKHVNAEALQLRSILLPWIFLELGRWENEANCWLGSNDIYTIWAAKMMQKICGWKFYIHPSMKREFPNWLDFDAKTPPANPGEKDVLLDLGQRKTSSVLHASGLQPIIL